MAYEPMETSLDILTKTELFSTIIPTGVTSIAEALVGPANPKGTRPQAKPGLLQVRIRLLVQKNAGKRKTLHGQGRNGKGGAYS